MRQPIVGLATVAALACSSSKDVASSLTPEGGAGTQPPVAEGGPTPADGDHVPPPSVDRWGPGTRVPTIVISPFAKDGYVDSTVYDTTSIAALIEHRYNLAPLGARDAAAADLTNAFDFGGP